MIWFNPSEYKKQIYKELRLYAPKDEKILLDFEPKDAFDGTLEPVFNVCSYNWIGKDDWQKIIFEIEKEFDDFSNVEKSFFQDFLEWLKEALKYTTIIVVEGNG